MGYLKRHPCARTRFGDCVGGSTCAAPWRWRFCLPWRRESAPTRTWDGCPPFRLLIVPELPDTDSIQRLLVVAPHCDDEVLVSGGLIREVLARGGRVQVVLITNGDGSFSGTIVEYRKLYPGATDYIRAGSARQQESLNALAALGVPADDVFFLSYPDQSRQPLDSRISCAIMIPGGAWSGAARAAETASKAPTRSEDAPAQCQWGYPYSTHRSPEARMEPIATEPVHVANPCPCPARDSAASQRLCQGGERPLYRSAKQKARPTQIARRQPCGEFVSSQGESRSSPKPT